MRALLRTVRYQLLHKDKHTSARRGRLTTPHGTVELPTFMPVGTAGSVKAMLPEEVASTRAQIVLGNTYHLLLRPGHDLVKRLGGLHRFMGWDQTILTDSGGFQVLSLKDLRTITEEGVAFRSPYDGRKHMLSPELSIEIQEALGTDIAMAFDECPPADAERDYVQRSMDRTTRWLQRCQDARKHPDKTSMFGIVQGGVYEDLRREHAEQVLAHDLDGYAIGGVAIGESKEDMLRVVNSSTGLLPEDRPRYLMGVGLPYDLVAAVSAGIDMFDCVVPTRNARTGRIFTSNGIVVVKNASNREDSRPLDENCGCPTCQRFSRAYIRHLWTSGELLVHRLTTMHNLWFFGQLMARIRSAIETDTMAELLREVTAGPYGPTATKKQPAASPGDEQPRP
ncbi:MAG: tRNA guanosine(34) transglycosylase Tgt [Myxococcota bacterium]